MPPDLEAFFAQADASGGATFGRYLARLCAAVVVGVVVSLAYRASTRRPAAELARLSTTLVLLTVLVAMTALVVDNSVARAFSLVGALSIVRFRTVVEDSRDTAFVIFAVVSGMTLGVGNWMLCVVGVPLVALVAYLQRMRAANGDAAGSFASPIGQAGTATMQQLVVRLGAGRDPESVLGEALRRHLLAHRLVRTTTVRQGAALELAYRVLLRADAKPVALVAELNALEGVQHVELAEA